MRCHGEMAKKGKPDGGSCVGHKEIKAPNLLLCKTYTEFKNAGKNVMCILRRLITIFTTLMPKYTIQVIILIIY